MTSTSTSPDVPPFHGYVETTVNALRLIHAARQGVIPRITRRLNDTERRSMIKSGAVFIFSVEESGIKRWTDGLLWSPSRIVGNFLVYREINERASSRSGSHKKTYAGDDSRALSIHRNSPGSPAGYKTSSTSGSDQGTFKPGGLIKKTITVTIEGSDLHLISYYTSEDIRSGRLKRPSSRPDIMGLYMPPHIFRLTNFRVPPKVEIGPDGKPRLVSEPEDDTPECKIEEQTYPSPTHSHSSTSSVDNSFPGNQLYPLHHTTGSSIGYLRNTVPDRWQGGIDALRAPTPLRQEGTWPMSSGSNHSSHSVSRRDTSLSTDSWSTLHSHPARWQNDSYDSSVPSSDSTLERSRIRSSNHPYQNAAALRDHETLPSFGHRYSVSRSNRDVGSQRLPWPMHGDTSSGDKDSGRTLNSSSRSSYASNSSLPFASENFSYPTGWGSSEATSNLDVAPQAPFSPQPTLQNYNSTYSSGSD
ncbi:hypothetical protein Moror_974 [Moniliophthora roreri MCA 2997]|uniref:Camp independent regulatory protein n=1 Tax=Moniliophthora roreri (strain MCA 2997) TaxID=1381753 RepID=V2XTR8_MONRO|nr:hypothetical protein Moror_974 [Moniliophthora roreri MCA 2997]KAI3615795.1 hypothetical protein WG66_010293 [Moniliophthora roreri]